MAERVGLLIVGAGPTGLMAACLLARFGLGFRIVDESEGPAKGSRAMVVQARSLELALLMGCADRFLDRGMVVGGIEADPGRVERGVQARRFGPDAPQALLLLRPDGHIAFRADRLDVVPLRAFFDRFGPVGT